MLFAASKLGCLAVKLKEQAHLLTLVTFKNAWSSFFIHLSFPLQFPLCSLMHFPLSYTFNNWYLNVCGHLNSLSSYFSAASQQKDPSAGLCSVDPKLLQLTVRAERQVTLAIPLKTSIPVLWECQRPLKLKLGTKAAIEASNQ